MPDDQQPWRGAHNTGGFRQNQLDQSRVFVDPGGELKCLPRRGNRTQRHHTRFGLGHYFLGDHQDIAIQDCRAPDDFRQIITRSNEREIGDGGKFNGLANRLFSQFAGKLEDGARQVLPVRQGLHYRSGEPHWNLQ